MKRGSFSHWQLLQAPTEEELRRGSRRPHSPTPFQISLCNLKEEVCRQTLEYPSNLTLSIQMLLKQSVSN